MIEEKCPSDSGFEEGKANESFAGLLLNSFHKHEEHSL